MSPRNSETETKKKRTGAIDKKNSADAIQAKINEKLNSDNDSIYLHNVSGMHFHVAPHSFKAGEHDTREEFELGQVRNFHKGVLKEERFRKPITQGKLVLVEENQIEAIEREQEKAIEAEEAKRKGNKKNSGLAPSGLPNSKGGALQYIYACEDIDELYGYLDMEDREVIEAALQERIDELEG